MKITEKIPKGFDGIIQIKTKDGKDFAKYTLEAPLKEGVYGFMWLLHSLQEVFKDDEEVVRINKIVDLVILQRNSNVEESDKNIEKIFGNDFIIETIKKGKI